MALRIGINADSSLINGDLSILERILRGFQSAGFSHVEIPVHGLDCIINSALCSKRLANTQRILEKFPFSYSVHAPDGLNLADGENREAHCKALLATIDFASEIGAGIVVYHGSHMDKPAGPFAGVEDWTAETDRLGKIAAHAEKRHVIVAVENIFRQSPLEVTYRIDPRELAKIVLAVGSPSLAICFDFGHAFISANEENFAIGDALCAALPRIAHIHVHDNFGKPWGKYTRTIDSLPLGAGDLHLPPGWGIIPYDLLLPILLPAYKGVFMMEIQPRFSDLYGEAINWVRSMVE
ncbi:MAG: sugar phosphate isomerase/epimerase [Spirochaetaceae bacterium]|nr:sugar phosphate isomerase/epimerase [Spirochaetaceae bacterium]